MKKTIISEFCARCGGMMHRMHRVFTVILSSLVMLSLGSCGGGEGSSSLSFLLSMEVFPVIVAEVVSFPTGAVPPGFAPSIYNTAAYVEISDVNSGIVINTATVSINGNTLSYNSTDKMYEGYLNILQGDTVNLSVTIKGRTYSVSGTQFTSYPVITSPTSGAEWSGGTSHLLKWSGGGPKPRFDSSYSLAILDANDPNGNMVWPPDNYLWDVGLDVTSNIIPANSLSAGNRLAITGISQEIIYEYYNSHYIGLYIGGFNYVPFTVIASQTPTNVSAVRGNGQVTLNWSPVEGATSYSVYWSYSPANANTGSGNQVPDVSSPYLHDGLTNGTPYYYSVTAVTGGIESSESTPVAYAIPGTVLMGGTVQGYPLNLSNTITNIAGSQVTGGYADLVGTAARFDYPNGITTDGTDLYVADTHNNIIRKVNISTGEVTTFAGRPGVWGSADGVGTGARFCGPFDITTDGINLYVADGYNYTIRKIVISTREVTTLAGSPQQFGSSDGTGSAARFNVPIYITTDGTYLYVADTFNYKVRKVEISTRKVTTLAGGYGGSTGFKMPKGITTDGTNLYVADRNDYTIRKVVISSGEVSTLAGKTGVSGSADGTGENATFNGPTGITTDGTYLYVTDLSKIRKVNITTGETTTLPNANFSNATGIVTNGIDLYLLDSNSVASIQ